MSNNAKAVKRKKKLALRPDGKRCPRCRRGRMTCDTYPDAFLFICRACKFPIRVERGRKK